jgi:probable HAF family extracellular repeat protein
VMPTRSRRLASPFLVAGLLAAVALAAPAAAQPPLPTYAVVDLGLPQVAADVEVRGINAAGAVVGTVDEDVSGGIIQHPFLWQGGTYTVLDGAVPEGQATAINARSEIVGVVYAPGTSHAVRWVNGQATDLGTLPGATFAVAQGLDEHGDVVGASGRGNTSRAVVWQGGAVTALAAVDAADMAVAINANDQVVGSTMLGGTDVGPTRAVLWEKGGYVDLGTLGGDASEAWQINDQGQVVGDSTTTPGDRSPTHAFLWQAGAMTDLGTLAGYEASSARDVNNAGQIVGTASNPNSPDSVAVLWVNGQIVDLNSLLPADSAVQLREAVAITDDGQILCTGWAKDDRRTHGFILTPVAP